jgi:hypothetical protein
MSGDLAPSTSAGSVRAILMSSEQLNAKVVAPNDVVALNKSPVSEVLHLESRGTVSLNIRIFMPVLMNENK